MNTLETHTGQGMESPARSLKLSEATEWGHILSPAFITRLANDIYANDYRLKQLPENVKPVSMEPETNPGEQQSSGNGAILSESSNYRTSTENSIPLEESSPKTFIKQNQNNMPAKTVVKPDTSKSSGPVHQEYYFLRISRIENVPRSKPVVTNESIAVQAVRKDFPILKQCVYGKPLIWFDNAATTQKPQSVLDTLDQYYRDYNSNVHRASHSLAKQATTSYEAARCKIQHFIGAADPEEVIFLRGTTEAINLVAQTYGRMKIHAGDEILISHMEHHSNIVPWQMLRQEKGAVIKIIPINDRGEILLDEYEKLFTPRTRMVAITHVSNVLGTINPLKAMIEAAHYHKACVLVDGAQSAPHFKVDVKDLDADFYVFSGHKVYGPTGIGILFGKKALLEEMPPWQGGGGMIKEVTFNKTLYNNLPYKFEAGTANIADAVGLGTAVDYLQKIGLANIERHERNLTDYATAVLSTIPGLCLIGTSLNKISVISFIVRGFSPEELAHYLDQEGIAVRTGHHCAQPVLERFGVTNTLRVSLGLYNTREEVDTMLDVLSRLIQKNH